MLAIEAVSIEIEPVETSNSQKNNLAKYRDEFRAAVDKDSDWRDEALEDVEFYYGKQWDDQDKLAMSETGRPVITINRIKPLINLLSGYQRLNRFEPEFLPRTKDDIDLCMVRKGVTKYIMDQCDYASVESAVFLDGAITGRGWFEVSYDWDYSTLDGYVNIKRVSPFDVYIDPESVNNDYSDAKFLFKAKWTDKEELKAIYPEHADIIDLTTNDYDTAEDMDRDELEPLWYQQETNRVRVVERWGKRTEQQTFYLLNDGRLVPRKEISVEDLIQIKKPVMLPTTSIYVSVFIGEVMLEEKDSPYQHGEFPLIPFVAYYLGEGDVPAGVVRDIKDVQREVNKRRSQSLHILSTQANSGWIYERGAIDARQKDELSKFGSTPGAQLEVSDMGKVQRISPPNPHVGVMQAEQYAVADIRDISGINEAMLGTDIAQSASGRAIELRQRQAVTHIGALFDNLRKSKLQLLFMLWGKRGKKGIVQQYYTEQKTFRIIGDNGKPDFVEINKPVMVNDPLRGAVQQTINDLSAGEFDIVVSDVPSTATHRQAQFWALTDAISKLGIPGDMVFDLLLDMSDIPNREEIKRRWNDRQEQMKSAGHPVQNKFSTSINIKDLPPDAQAQMLAQIGVQVNQQQQNPLIPLIQSLPPQAVIAMSRMQPEQLLGAATLLFQQLPQDAQQQLGMALQGIQPQQIMEMMQDAINTVVSSIAGQQQEMVPPQSAIRQQPQTMTRPAMQQAMSDMQVGM